MSEQQIEAFVAGVRATIARQAMLSRGEQVVVAVSGGADSLALLHALNALRAELSLALHVAHLNHRLRRAAAADARFVAATAERLGLPCTVAAVDVRAVKRATGLSLEHAARRERYRFLARVAAAIGAQTIATGHTADDNVETVLLNLLRGAGPDGLAGIPPVGTAIPDCEPETAAGPGPRLVRPLIETWRTEVEAYVQALGLEPREDITNRSRAYLRNRVRLELLPYLQRHFGPQVKPNLQRLSWLARPETELLESLATEALGRVARLGPGRVELSCPELRGLPLALQRRVVRAALRQVKGTPEEIGFREIERVREAAGATAVQPFDLPGPIRVTAVGRWLVLSPPEVVQEPEALAVPLPVPGQAPAPGGGTITTALMPKPEGFQVPRVPRARAVTLDADAVTLPLEVRTWRPGDRFVPLGLGGHQTLHKLFIGRKVPAAERARTPIVADAQGILWVAGIAIADRARVQEHTRRLLCLRWE